MNTIGSRRSHAVHRCGLSLHMLHVAWSVRLRVKLCKTDEPIVMRSEGRLMWAQEMGSRSPTEVGSFMAVSPDVIKSERVQCKAGFNYKGRCAAAMRPFANLLWTLVANNCPRSFPLT